MILLGVDAFSAVPFGGNPAAVCLLDSDDVEPSWMQAVAAEMNLSETAFVGAPDGDGVRSLRWFTPTTEVQLCGHATLASAHALWETGVLRADDAARFRTRTRGELVARREATGEIALDLPAYDSGPVAEPDGLAAALGAPVTSVWENDLHHLVELADEEAVRDLAPDLQALRAVPVEAVAVTAASRDDRFDFVSRYFAPRHGIDEDPVTGSAHATLGPWWAQRLGRDEVVGHQLSARGGVVRVRPAGDRATIVGRAVTVWQGSLRS